MARLTVRITRLLADVAATGRDVDVEAATAVEALDALCETVPALRVHVFADDGTIRRHVNIFVNGEIIQQPGELEQSLSDGDEVAVMQAVSGG